MCNAREMLDKAKDKTSLLIREMFSRKKQSPLDSVSPSKKTEQAESGKACSAA